MLKELKENGKNLKEHLENNIWIKWQYNQRDMLSKKEPCCNSEAKKYNNWIEIVTSLTQAEKIISEFEDRLFEITESVKEK